MVAKNCWGEAKTLPCVGRERYRTLCHRWVPMAGAVINQLTPPDY
jgi:hypothetical protein